jgi:hypothetical protein
MKLSRANVLTAGFLLALLVTVTLTAPRWSRALMRSLPAGEDDAETAAAPAAAATAAVAAPAAATAARPLLHRSRFVDLHGPAFEVGAIERGYRSARLRVGAHLDEAEALALTRVAVRDQLAGLDPSMRRELGLERLLRGREWQISDV